MFLLYSSYSSCSVESSEIDLSEFQEENRDDGDNGNDGNNSSGQDNGQASVPASEPANGAGEILLHLLPLNSFLLKLICGDI